MTKNKNLLLAPQAFTIAALCVFNLSDVDTEERPRFEAYLE